MEDSARMFMTTTSQKRAEMYWHCYLEQTKHNLNASKQYERCVALEHGVGAEFAQALRKTSVLAARLGALIHFAKQKGYKLPDDAEHIEEEGLRLSGERFIAARTVESKLLSS